MSNTEKTVLAGSLFVANGARGTQPLIALSAADGDGFIRFAPVITGEKAGQGFGMALESADFQAGEGAGRLRLDRVGWNYVEGAETIGALKPKALARLHRALCTYEARSYADIAHGPAAFVPGRTSVPPSGKVIGARELELLVESSLDGWLTTGRFSWT